MANIENYIYTLKKLSYGSIRGEISNFNISDQVKDYIDNVIFDWMKDSHIFVINKEIDIICKNTKNEICWRKLPYDIIFIDTEFKFKNCFIKGVLCTQGNYSDQKEVICITCVLNDYSEKKNIRLTEFLDDRKKYNGYDGRSLITNIKISRKDMDTIWLYICNFLDFLYSPEIESHIVERSKEQNRKRILKGKIPIPPQVFVRVSGKLKIYLDSLNSRKEMQLSHRFDVRGHWRILRSEKWKNKRGTKIWIPNYIKGSGIYIKKNYSVQGTEEQSKKFI